MRATTSPGATSCRPASSRSTASPSGGSWSRGRATARLRAAIGRVFERPHSIADELKWLDSEGPTSPALVRHIGARRNDFDFFIFFSYRYYHAWHGARAVMDKAILVPTAERDPAIGLSIFGPVFRGVRAVMYNSFEERALIQGATAPSASRRRRRRRLGRSRCARTRAIPQEVPRAPAVRDLPRPDRREQGLQPAVRVLRAVHA